MKTAHQRTVGVLGTIVIVPSCFDIVIHIHISLTMNTKSMVEIMMQAKNKEELISFTIQ